MYLDWDSLEMLAMVFMHKMSPKEFTIVDGRYRMSRRLQTNFGIAHIDVTVNISHYILSRSILKAIVLSI